MTDFRALCAELLDEAIHLGQLPYEQDPGSELVDRARAALAQPEPEVLARVEFGETEFNCPSDVVLAQYCDDWFFGNPRDEVDPVDLCRGAIKLFAQMPTPIPVSERPEPEDCDAEGRCWFFRVAMDGVGDWHQRKPFATGRVYSFFRFTHWLPHHALPVPAPSREEILEASND